MIVYAVWLDVVVKFFFPMFDHLCNINVRFDFYLIEHYFFTNHSSRTTVVDFCDFFVL